MLPQAFLQRMENQLGEEYPQFLESLQRPRAVALRFNPLKIRDGNPPLPFVQENVPWEPMGYYYDPSARPGRHPFHEAGVYYLQEASAMSAVALLDPQPGEKICDLCAAPGGKSTQIAGRMQGKGLLLCNEIHPQRAKILSRNVERMGVPNAVVTNERPDALAKRFPGFFDRVLVDAPCSGEGMFRKEEAAVTDWSPEIVSMCAQRQKEILNSAAAMVRPGGVLVYSTCTFAPEEDEQTVSAFLESHRDFVPEDVPAPWFVRTQPGCLRVWPHRVKGEGHFAAVLRKMGQKEEEHAARSDNRLPGEAADFLKELGICLPDGCPVQFGQTLCLAPRQMPDTAGLKVIRMGLELGVAKKGRFEPSHALALWLNEAARQVDLPAEGEEIGKYLHGEVLPIPEKGWCLIRADGFSLGWGKGDGVQIKNHYPKGLRQ